jgi:hypothetical protein
MATEAHTINRLSDREALLSKGPVGLRCSHECRLPHGQENKIVKIVLCLDIVHIRPLFAPFAVTILLGLCVSMANSPVFPLTIRSILPRLHADWGIVQRQDDGFWPH